MPRRKQGHSKDSATGGCLKKKTDTGIDLIQNESLKHIPTNNDLVFKIKKTASSTVFNPSCEKIEREHIEASKSLNDNNVVTQNEVNNNLLKYVEIEVENIVKAMGENSCCETNSKNNDNTNCLTDVSSEVSKSNIAFTSSSDEKDSSVVKTLNKKLKKGFLTEPETVPEMKPIVSCSENTPVKVVVTVESASVKLAHHNSDFEPTSVDIKLRDEKLINAVSDKRSAEFCTSQMSGVTPIAATVDGSVSKSESQQMNYRVSTSVMESKNFRTQDSLNIVIKEEQNCNLPSSVYGTPASNIEKVLTGLQVSEDSRKDSLSAIGKSSFLQEILEKKPTGPDLYDSRQLNSSCKNETFKKLKKSHSLQQLQPDLSDAKGVSNSFSDFKNNVPDVLHSGRLKLHIPEVLSNDDSDSSVFSSDSQKLVKCPKITSPQILEQHISKIISENAAIVETLDPMWSRRFLKQTNLNSSTNNEGESKKSGTFLKLNRPLDEKVINVNAFSDTNNSKLQSALLGGSETDIFNQKKQLSPNVCSTREKNSTQINNFSTNVSSVNMCSKIVSSVSEDELKGSAIKSLLSLKRGRYPKHKSSFGFEQDLYNQHPQNPEGSIIKDLLLKSKLKEESKLSLDRDDPILSTFNSGFPVDINNSEKLYLKCSLCSTEFTDKYTLDTHYTFCKSNMKQLFSLRENAERINFKCNNAQAMPLISDFSYNLNMKVQDDASRSDSASEGNDDGLGPILKKQLLLPLSKSPPLKRRKVSDSILASSYLTEQSFGNMSDKSNISKSVSSKSLNTISVSPHPVRSQSVHLFGGEVQILDGEKTKRIKIKTSIPGAFSLFPNRLSENYLFKKSELAEDLEVDKGGNSLPAVIVTIAQPVHNSGGTVHLPTRRSSSNVAPVVTISSNISDAIPKFPKLEVLTCTDPSRISIQSELLKPPSEQKESSLQKFSSPPFSLLPNADIKCLSSSSSILSPSVSSSTKYKDFKSSSFIDELSPLAQVAVSPINKPFYSPIIPSIEKSFELAVARSSKEMENQNNQVVPTVIFTPSSPTLPSSDNETLTTSTSSISESPKKFLAPARPTSLPLKKKPFTMVGSTLISPETPRPKKSCIQLYLNGHAYTYLGLKCSTRSTYCCIYRPQPMFVLQETNPKLSMYSNWQVVPAKEELCGLTPGQMISFYSSKQRRDEQSLTVMAKVGEPLSFTHSSYWTYRSQDHSEKSDMNKPATEDLNKEEFIDSTEKMQDSAPEKCSNSDPAVTSVGKVSEFNVHSSDETSVRLDTDNTLSDADINNSNEDDDEDDDCQDDGTESLTDSSQPQPPKRVRIFEGGYKSNEEYTYVRGRGRGKYVCEECGIRCKKPSMLKKHIRTHTDLRPYKCRHCSFAFKTKGNLTKHMKSKAHHKKCTELGIIPVPTTTDDSQIDEEALAKQEQIEKKKPQFSDGEDADDDDDDDTDESDDECESDGSSLIASNQKSRMLTNGHSKTSESQDKLSVENFDDSTRGTESVSQQSVEQEAARSLLHLSALGEPSQWSTSTGDLTDVTSSGETETGSIAARHEQSLLSPQYPQQTLSSIMLPRSKTVSDHWLSTETLGHRPRSYSADIPLGGKEHLLKYKLTKSMTSDSSVKSPLEESAEFSSREQYTRRYSISVAREARKPRVLQPPDWSSFSASSSLKWPDVESSDQPMDLSVSRDLTKCKSMYSSGLPGPLMNVIAQAESVPDANMSGNLDPCLNESYQLKSLPVLSPQVLVDYEPGNENGNNDTTLLPMGDDQTTFNTNTTTRPILYMQDIPPAPDNVGGRKEIDTSEDPPSPDISDYAACSPVSPSALDENSYYYTQESMGHSTTTAEEMPPTSRFHAEFIVPSTSSSGMEEGKCVCRICNKIFAKSSHLRLHVNIHYFERPFRCDNCAVSFRTKGHLQKHKRSVSHYNKVNMNLTFGTPTVDNPRPFKCADCKIAFRIHGHLAKHLRSKMHIMKLECLGKLPFGMYAEMERSGVSLNEIDTTDCNNSLESLQVMAQKLYQRDPRRMRWQGTEQPIADTDCTGSTPLVATTLIDTVLPLGESLNPAYDPNCTSVGIPPVALASSKHASENDEVKQEPSDPDSLRIASAYSDAESAISPLTRYVVSQPMTAANQDTGHRPEAPENDSVVSLHRSGTCHICGRLFKSAKFLQVHLYSDHSGLLTSVNDAPTTNNSISSAAGMQEFPCDLCGRQFTDQKLLQQHLLSHAQPRPFVCEVCDAGFTSSSSLIAHKATHQTGSSTSAISETRLVQLK